MLENENYNTSEKYKNQVIKSNLLSKEQVQLDILLKNNQLENLSIKKI